MEIQGVDEENETSQLAQSNEECTFRIEDVRSLQPRDVKYCRLCAMPSSCPVSIFDKQGQRMHLANKINLNLPIMVKEDSRLPLHVCWDCIKQLNASINFVKQCLSAQLKIESMFKDSLKGRHSNQMPIVSNEENVDAEECSSISRSVSNQLISKEITSNDKTRKIRKFVIPDSLKGRHSTQMSIISNEKNVDAEECSSISRSVSNQLISKEITSNDKTRKIRKFVIPDSLKGRHSTQMSIISNEKNVDAEECSSISRSVSNQLISKEITSNDKTRKIRKFVIPDSLKGRHSTQMSIISNEKNVDAEECSSISRSVSNQLIWKKITSRDIHGKSNDLSDVNLMDNSNLRKRDEEKRNGQSLSSKEMEHNEDEHISNTALQKIPVLEISDSDNEYSAAGNIMENTEKKSNDAEQNSHTSHDGFDLKNPENVIGVYQTKAQLGNSIIKRNKEMKYQCQYCQKSYKWKADLFQHQTFAHPDLVFCCYYCDKVFYESKEDLIRHENAHEMLRAPQISRRPLKIPKISRLSISKLRSVKGHPIAKWEIRRNVLNKLELITRIPTNDRDSKNKKDDSSESVLDENSKEFIGKNSSDSMPINSIKGDVNVEIGSKTSVQGKMSLAEREGSNCVRIRKLYECIECDMVFGGISEQREHRRNLHQMMFPCRFCPRTFIGRETFNSHEAFHLTLKKRRRCSRCSASYNTRKELRRHGRAVHTRVRCTPIKCMTCSKSFTDKQVYLKHIELHDSAPRYLCEWCGRCFITSSDLYRHRSTTCVKPVEKKFSCELCGRKFQHQSELNTHKRWHVGEKLLCFICGKSFRESYMSKHLECHSVPRLACSFCGMLVKANSQLVTHMKQHSNCDVCNLDYSGNVKAHLLHRKEFHSLEVEGELAKGFGGLELTECEDGRGKKGDFSETAKRCENCGRLFASSFWMRLHQEKRCVSKVVYKCQVCDKIMHCAYKYKKHMFKKHSEERPFQCSHCPQKFDIRKSLVKHELEHEEGKPYACSKCGKKFRSLSNLRCHLEVHSPLETLSCDICDKKFIRKKYLTRHKAKIHQIKKPVEVHSPLETLSCDICDKKFIRKRYLTRHKAKIHQIKKPVFHCSICNQMFPHQKLAQAHELSHVEEQKLSAENINTLLKDYNLNLGERSFAVNNCLDNVGGEVLIYDSQSIESTYSEIIIVSNKADDNVMHNSDQI